MLGFVKNAAELSVGDSLGFGGKVAIIESVSLISGAIKLQLSSEREPVFLPLKLPVIVYPK